MLYKYDTIKQYDINSTKMEEIAILAIFGIALILVSIKFIGLKKTIIGLPFLFLGFNIQKVLGCDNCYIGGIRMYYRLIVLHIVDLSVLVSLSFIILGHRFKRLSLFAKIAISLLIINSILHVTYSNIFYSIRYAIYIMYFDQLLKQNSLKVLYKLMIPGIIANLGIAILQVLLRHSIGLSILGESIIYRYQTRVAILRLHNIVFLRSYGFFSHPNVLAVYFAIFWMMTHKKYEKFAYWIAIVISILAFSKSVFAVLIIAKLIKKIRLSQISILLFSFWVSVIPVICSFLARLYYCDTRNWLIQKSIEIIRNHWLLGVGFGSFTANIINWQANMIIDPVHNIVLLLFSETGIFIGGILVVLLLYIIIYNTDKVRNITKYNNLMIFVVILGLLDHYFLTLPNGIFMFGIALMLINSLQQGNAKQL